MARIRSIKPSFFHSLTIASLSFSARLTFIGLWTYADDEGKGVDDARLIKSQLWPLDDKHTLRKVSQDMEDLAARGLITRYTVGSRDFFAISAWKEHQNINRPQDSSSPDPTEFTERSVKDHGALKGERKGKERNGLEGPPREFVVSDEMKTWATKKGFNWLNLESETEAFLDHHASKGSKFADWTRAWQTWIRNADKWGDQRGSKPHPTPESGSATVPKGAGGMFANEAEREAWYASELGEVVELPEVGVQP